MNKKDVDYTLYLVTDREIMSAESIEKAVSDALDGGGTVLQLREKNCSSREFYEIALSLKKICEKKNVPLIINDRADICMAADCDGVHIGKKDIPAVEVRKIIGKDKIMGVSASTVEAAIKAEKDGADYIGVGAVFSTSTKTDTTPVSIKTLAEIKERINIPVVAIGGIKEDNISCLKDTGIDGAAVVSAVFAKENIFDAALKMRKALNDIRPPRKLEN